MTATFKSPLIGSVKAFPLEECPMKSKCRWSKYWHTACIDPICRVSRADSRRTKWGSAIGVLASAARSKTTADNLSCFLLVAAAHLATAVWECQREIVEFCTVHIHFSWPEEFSFWRDFYWTLTNPTFYEHTFEIAHIGETLWKHWFKENCMCSLTGCSYRVYNRDMNQIMPRLVLDLRNTYCILTVFDIEPRKFRINGEDDF